MPNHVWYLTAPDGRVVGAAVDRGLHRGPWLYSDGAYRAVSDALSGVPADDLHAAAHALRHAIHANPTATRYEAAGYVLARGEVAGV